MYNIPIYLSFYKISPDIWIEKIEMLRYTSFYKKQLRIKYKDIGVFADFQIFQRLYAIVL